MSEEIFYFYPERFGYNPCSIEEVHLAGEFNDWGKNTQLLDKYRLIQDKSGKWVGIFDVAEGHGIYKFLLNKNTYAPCLNVLHYSTVSTPDWAKKAIWYQIITDRFHIGNGSKPLLNQLHWDSPPDYFNNFGGNLRGIKEKIPYLNSFFGSLKNKAFYLNPLHLSKASNHKYWPEDFEQIDPQIGSENDLKELAQALHNEGARIIIDLVYNHTGINHYAFLDILKHGSSSKYFHWYRHIPHKIEIPVLESCVEGIPQNLAIINDPRDSEYDPEQESFIDIWQGKYRFPINNPNKHKNSSTLEIIDSQPYYRLISVHERGNYSCWVNLFELPELNTKNPELKEHLFQSALKWLKLGVDGFRLDVPDLLADAQAFWADFRQYVRKNHSEEIYITGEIWTGEGLGATYLCPDREAKPMRFDSIMNYPIRECVLNFLSGEILNKASDSVMCQGDISVSELDKNIHNNISYLSWGVTQVQYGVFSSHDTRRLRSVFNDDRKMKAAVIMQFTLPGTPAIYYGEEIGMTGGKDPQNRSTMSWDKADNLAYYPEEASIYEFYQKLISLRENMPCLINAPVLTLTVYNERKVYAYARYSSSDDCIIVIVAKDGITHDINIDLSGLPFEDIPNWREFMSEKYFACYAKNIVIKPSDFDNSHGLVLTAVCE